MKSKMKVQDLLEILQKLNLEDTVVIRNNGNYTLKEMSTWATGSIQTLGNKHCVILYSRNK